MSVSFVVVAKNTRGDTLEIGCIFSGRYRTEKTLMQSAKNVISHSPKFWHLPVDKLEYKIESERIVVLTKLDRYNQPIFVNKVKERWDHKQKNSWRS